MLKAANTVTPMPRSVGRDSGIARGARAVYRPFVAAVNTPGSPGEARVAAPPSWHFPARTTTGCGWRWPARHACGLCFLFSLTRT